MSIIIAVLVFSFLVITHELGHFLMAKRAGIGVVEFSVGMGPRLFQVQKGETRYSLKLIPFGGSCMMVGEDEDSEAENAFGKKSVWARILVVAGGPLFNFVFAFLLSALLVALEGVNPARVTAVAPDYGAGAAGIAVGDTIVAIDGDRIHIGRDINMHFLEYPMDGSPLEVTYERDGQRYTTMVDPNYTRYRGGFTYIPDENPAVLVEVEPDMPAAKAGLLAGDQLVELNGQEITDGLSLERYTEEHPMSEEAITVTYLRDGVMMETVMQPKLTQTLALGMNAVYYRERAGLFGTLAGAGQEMRYSSRLVLVSLKMLLQGEVSLREMSGPVGIVSVIHSTVEESSVDGAYYVFLNIVSLAVLLSVNLGIFNLLPIPALDGGRLVFLFVEAVRRKPVPADKEGLVHTIGFVLLMGLMVFVLFNDITRLLQ